MNGKRSKQLRRVVLGEGYSVRGTHPQARHLYRRVKRLYGEVPGALRNRYLEELRRSIDAQREAP